MIRASERSGGRDAFFRHPLGWVEYVSNYKYKHIHIYGGVFFFVFFFVVLSLGVA